MSEALRKILKNYSHIKDKRTIINCDKTKGSYALMKKRNDFPGKRNKN